MSASKKKSGHDEHYAALRDNEAHGDAKKHPERGCAFRCGRKGHNHRENGYEYTKANYHSAYNIDFTQGANRNRFDSVFGTRIFRNQKGWDPRFSAGTWHIGAAKPNNYLKGRHPFTNQHHHILPVGTLHKILDTTEVKLLMQSGYNINTGENIIILPTELDVSRVMLMLRHPGSHPAYNSLSESKVNQIKATLSEAADEEEEGHDPLEEPDLPNLKADLNQWAIVQWGQLYIYGKAKKAAGLTVNEAAKAIQNFFDPFA